MIILALIFDLDDTLYDERDYVASGFEQVAHKIASDYNLYYEDIYNDLLELFKHDRANVFDRLLEQLNICYNENYVRELVSIYRSHYPNIRLRDDARWILEYAKGNGYKIGLITDGDSIRQQMKLRALGIEHIFDAVVISGENPGGLGKPDVFPYKRCLGLLEVRPDQAVYIADNPVKDFIGARAIGVKTVRMLNERGLYKCVKVNKGLEADYIIKDLRELTNVIEIMERDERK